MAGYREHMARRDLAPGTVAARLRVAGMLLDGLGGDAAADGLEDLTPRRVLAVLRSWGPLARRRSSELRASCATCVRPGIRSRIWAPRSSRRGRGPRRAVRRALISPRQRPCWTGWSGPVSAASATARSSCWWPAWDCAPASARLALDDIRWRGGSLVIHRKGGRAEEFPLLADVGLALAEYLRARSPAPGTRAVFVTTVALRRAMTRQGIGQVVRTACARAGWPAGPHQFRHLLRHLAAGRGAAGRRGPGAGAPGPGGHRRVRGPRPVAAGGADPALAAGGAMTGMRQAAGEYLALRRALGTGWRRTGSCCGTSLSIWMPAAPGT